MSNVRKQYALKIDEWSKALVELENRAAQLTLQIERQRGAVAAAQALLDLLPLDSPEIEEVKLNGEVKEIAH